MNLVRWQSLTSPKSTVMSLCGISIKCSLDAHFTTRFGNCLLRVLILCKMSCKLTSALQYLWSWSLLFLPKNHLRYPTTRFLLIQTPWVSYPLFSSSNLILVPLLSAAHSLGSLNLMRSCYKLQFFKYYYFVFVLAVFFRGRAKAEIWPTIF